MGEICASGSVGGEGGNALAYPAGGKLPGFLLVAVDIGWRPSIR